MAIIGQPSRLVAIEPHGCSTNEAISSREREAREAGLAGRRHARVKAVIRETSHIRHAWHIPAVFAATLTAYGLFCRSPDARRDETKFRARP